ncbi:MAG: uncharacterized protein PWR02_874 [Synergistales bacterium]|nr:uncharacterized protein [Synergistales bacterium]
MIIDTHVHLYPPDVVREWEKIAEKEPYFRLLCSGKVHKWAVAEDLFEMMESDHIDQCWVTSFAFRDPGLCRHCNDYVIETSERSGGRVKGLAVVNPLSRDFEKEIFRCREAGMIGVGELFPDGQVFDITDERQTWRLAAACRDAGMFLMLHTAEQVGHDYPGKGSAGPKEAAAFCLNHPGLAVVFAHMGGGLWQYEMMPEMKICLQNAWYDTAAVPFLYDAPIFRAVFAAGVGHKILYGSDFPLLRIKRFKRMLGEASLSPEEESALLGGNAKEVESRALLFSD